MKVFIENEAGYKLKNLFDEKKLEYQETIEVARAYPYPYGFLLDTTGEDGDNLDVFVLTNQKLHSGQIVEVEVIGLMEQFEQSWDVDQQAKEEIDHNIIAKLKADERFDYSDAVKRKLTAFVLHVFDNIRLGKTRVGAFHDKQVAMDFIYSNQD